jgi:hypothetical protein
MSHASHVPLPSAETGSTWSFPTAQANATRIEDKLQWRMQHLDFGAPRLWRCVGKGPKYTGDKDVKTHKVYVTFSWQARKLIRKGELVVNHWYQW